MPAYSFRREFAGAVERGEKVQTIRKPRKRPTVLGDTLYLYTGQRTKECRKLGEAIVGAVIPVEMGAYWVRVDGRRLSSEEVLALAQVDGFQGVRSFFRFFQRLYGLPCKLELIRWNLLEAEG